MEGALLRGLAGAVLEGQVWFGAGLLLPACARHTPGEKTPAANKVEKKRLDGLKESPLGKRYGVSVTPATPCFGIVRMLRF